MAAKAPHEQIINELTFIEVMCDQLKERCRKARMQLAPVKEPAPSGGRKRVSEIDAATIYAQRKFRLHHKPTKK